MNDKYTFIAKASKFSAIFWLHYFYFLSYFIKLSIYYSEIALFYKLWTFATLSFYVIFLLFNILFVWYC